jgi:arylsulfatase A
MPKSGPRKLSLGVVQRSGAGQGKATPYEGGIRVPAIIRWPGVVDKGRVSAEPIISIDYFPTIPEIAGVKPPDDREIDGLSLIPLLKGQTSLHRKAIYWHSPHYHRYTNSPFSIVRDGEWKLIKWYDRETFELYNLHEDISEANDLSDKMPEKVKDLNAELESWLKSVKAKMPKPNPDYKGLVRKLSKDIRPKHDIRRLDLEVPMLEGY